MKISPKVSIILPCRNEESALSGCLKKIKTIIKENNLNAEIIVSDSSTDNSPKIAKNHRVILIKHDKEGYGNACLEAFKVARGKYIFMADADGSYDFSQIPEFISYLDKGYDLVIGNRFKGTIAKKAMPFHHKYLGNPVLTALVKLFFKAKINDTQSGIRAIRKSSLERLRLQTTGMEFASEMIAKAMRNNLKTIEIPTNYNERIGKSKLKSFADGWRHIRFMLLYSPMFLFFIPGLILLLAGIDTLIWFYTTDPSVLGRTFIVHPMFISSLLTLAGYQLIIFSAFAKAYAVTNLGEESLFMKRLFKIITIEKASIFGLLITLIGLIIFIYILIKWIESGFGELNEIKNSIMALTLMLLGMQTIFSSFMISILGIKK